MANALSILDPDQVPDHVKKFLEENSNIPASDQVSTLSIRGKVFSVVIGGESTKLMRSNAEGEEEPVQIFPVVILAANEKRGRNFYEGKWDPEAKATPACWSNDGETPDASIKAPKSSKCATCPLSAKGSKQTDGEKSRDVAACSEFRLLAIVPAHDIEFEPLRLKIPVTSDWDGKNKEAQAKNWFGYKNYTDLLRSKGYKDTRTMSTKLRFDAGSEYPKLQFSPGKWLSPEALERVKEISETPAIKELLTVKFTAAASTEPETPAGVTDDDNEDGDEVVLTKPKDKAATAKAAVVEDDEDEDEDDKAIRLAQEKKAAKAAAQAAEAKAKAEADAKAKAAAKAKPVIADDDDEDAAIAAAIARKKAKEAAAKDPAAKLAATKAKAVVEDDDNGEAPPTSKPPAGKAKAATAPAAKPANVSPAVASVLGKWANDDED